jgi:hypothetical protein
MTPYEISRVHITLPTLCSLIPAHEWGQLLWSLLRHPRRPLRGTDPSLSLSLLSHDLWCPLGDIQIITGVTVPESCWANCSTSFSLFKSLSPWIQFCKVCVLLLLDHPLLCEIFQEVEHYHQNYYYNSHNLEFIQIENCCKIKGNGILSYHCASAFVLTESLKSACSLARLNCFLCIAEVLALVQNYTSENSKALQWPLTPKLDFRMPTVLQACLKTKFSSNGCFQVVDVTPHSLFPKWAGICFR